MSGIVIVGAGLAGLFTALKLAPLPVTVLSPVPLGEGASSMWAQGGIAAAVGEGDTSEAHARDTIAAGAGIVDDAVARVIAAEGPDRVRDLLDYGAPFDRDADGRYLLSREAAHSAKRVVRVTGDGAGAAIMQPLIARVRATPSIRVLEGLGAHALQVRDGRITGVKVQRDPAMGGGEGTLAADAVVLATGGVGQLYAVTTNPAHARGTGLIMALAAGAVIADAEFVQFHPTALDVGVDPAPLASEALRGEGATLVNRDGRRFMVGTHPDAELGPRDVVARAVFHEVQAGRGAFLDCRSAIGRHFEAKFPTIFAHCQRAGIDPAVDLIPIAPAAHFHMGGVETDLRGRASVAGLWAVGEVASTGLHGANRLASNSLLEAVVMGARVADDLSTVHADEVALSDVELRPSRGQAHSGDPSGLLARLRRTMTDNVGVVRTADGLRRALADLKDIGTSREPGVHVLMAPIASIIALSALIREESRGGHYRDDSPEAVPALARRSRMTADGAMEAWQRLQPELFQERP